MHNPRAPGLLCAWLLLVACNASGGTRPTVQQGASPEPAPAVSPEAEPAASSQGADDGEGISPVRHIGIYVHPYYASSARAEDAPTVHVGDRYDALLSSTRREDVVRARDLIEAEAAHVTPMSMMVLAIRLYDVGLRDEAVMWFYAAKGRYITLAEVIDVKASGLTEVSYTINAFSELVGPFINSYAFCDVDKQQQARRRATEWVIAHPYETIFLDRLVALPGDRKQNLEKAIGIIREGMIKERTLIEDPKALGELKRTRAERQVDAQFCWEPTP
ncbi:MAG: hypothetical protein OXT09_04590 [Myxococcales bacterium]|nr:hypothetical protein [Myxococcales bacterium]